MDNFLNKLSSYNFFNYLLPGVIFSVLLDRLTRYSFIPSDILTGVFFYYFVGLVISRIGSLIIEPILKGISFLKFEDYPNFVLASKSDEKVTLLSEINNSYRTLCALFAVLLLIKIYERVEAEFMFLREWSGFALLVLLFVMFLFSYRKQTDYVAQRIRVNLKNSTNSNS